MPAAQAKEPEAAAKTGPVTMTGTNSFGTLLSEEISAEQLEAEEVFSGGYSVIDLTIADAVATVEYSSLEEAILVVSIYSEDGLQMLASGKTTVKPENDLAEVTLVGEMPEYFLASAYLVDTYDYSPLCASYDTPMYTQEMQELLASTVDDYDADKILDLGGDGTTNFAVYADTTKIIDYVEGVNIVLSADDETATYVIKNADENFTSLQPGEIVAYSYGEYDVLLVKVDTITVDGTTVTITGAELDLEEVFSHVKIESAGKALPFAFICFRGETPLNHP